MVAGGLLPMPEGTRAWKRKALSRGTRMRQGDDRQARLELADGAAEGSAQHLGSQVRSNATENAESTAGTSGQRCSRGGRPDLYVKVGFHNAHHLGRDFSVLQGDLNNLAGIANQSIGLRQASREQGFDEVLSCQQIGSLERDPGSAGILPSAFGQKGHLAMLPVGAYALGCCLAIQGGSE